MLGAEESGGFGFGMHLPERDGIYADLLLLDLFLRERERGTWPVSQAVARFHDLATTQPVAGHSPCMVILPCPLILARRRSPLGS